VPAEQLGGGLQATFLGPGQPDLSVCTVVDDPEQRF
jgi:hypothetical protein